MGETKIFRRFVVSRRNRGTQKYSLHPAYLGRLWEHLREEVIHFKADLAKGSGKKRGDRTLHEAAWTKVPR